MRAVLAWIMIVHVIHPPIPVPDLDGECRGTPIHSLAESHAWHVMLISLQPNEDIDRGPRQSAGDSGDEIAGESPFGSSATLVREQTAPSASVVQVEYLTAHSCPNGAMSVQRFHRESPLAFDGATLLASPCAACVSFCSGQI